MIASTKVDLISCAPAYGVMGGKNVLAFGSRNPRLVVWDVERREVVKGPWENIPHDSSSINAVSFVEVNEERGLAIATNDGGCRSSASREMVTRHIYRVTMERYER